MFQVLSNLFYLIPAYLLFTHKRPYTASAFVILTLTSGIYHYTASIGDPIKFWQYADVSSIYLVLFLLPYAITKNKNWLYTLILPTIFLIGNKFNVILPSLEVNSFISVPLMALPTLLVAFSYIRRIFFYNSLAFMVFAVLSSAIANIFDMTGYGYDVPHGWWHFLSALSFTLLIDFDENT